MTGRWRCSTDLMVLGEEPPKSISSGPSHLPLPPQVKAGRAQVGNVKGRDKYSFWQIFSGGHTKYPSDSSLASTLILQLVLIPLSNKKRLQSDVPVLSASLKTNPPFVSPMKKIFFYFSLLPVSLWFSPFATFANTFIQQPLPLPECFELCYCMQWSDLGVQENYKTSMSFLAWELGRYIP